MADHHDEEKGVADGHDLIISYGDCELWGRCECGTLFGFIRPDQSIDKVLAMKWERHVMLEVKR